MNTFQIIKMWGDVIETKRVEIGMKISISSTDLQLDQLKRKMRKHVLEHFLNETTTLISTVGDDVVVTPHIEYNVATRFDDLLEQSIYLFCTVWLSYGAIDTLHSRLDSLSSLIGRE